MHSLRDSKYEYVRVRPRKDKDKDKDSDKRSSIAGSIIVKRHRDPGVARSVAPSDSASQVDAQSCTTAEELPPLPDSTDTSPLLRTTSASSLASRTSTSQIQTPSTLQPYLESETDDEASTVHSVNTIPESEETKDWIGPDSGSSKIPDESEDSQTPKPVRRVASDPKSKEIEASSQSGIEGPYLNPFLSSQLADPFLPTSTTLGQPISPHISDAQVQPYQHTPPQPTSSPAQSWHDAPTQHPGSVVSSSAGHSVVSGSSSTTTYIGHSQPTMYGHRGHHAYPAHIGDGPMLLLQRVSSAMPDVYLLMQKYQESCAMLGMRDNRIRQLESQKEIDDKRQDENIERLSDEIQQVLARHTAKVSKLETKISKLEGYQTDLHRSLAREVKSKDETKIANESLRAEQREMENRHRQEKEELTESHLEERNRLVSDHVANQRALSDHAQTQARIAEANMKSRIGEIIREREKDMQMLEERWAQERREIEDGHAAVQRDLEEKLRTKTKTIDDERRDYTKVKQGWEKERDELGLRRNDERVRHRKELEDQSQSLIKKHEKERDDVMKSAEALHTSHQAKSQATIREQERALESHSRQEADAQSLVVRLQQDSDTHKRYAAEAQEALRKLQKENTDMRSTLEVAQVRYQQQTEILDKTRKIHSENVQNRSRTPSLSRQRSDPQENIKLKKDLENERGRNENAVDTINRLRRDMEVPKAHWSKEGKKEQLPSSQRGNPDERKTIHLQKTTSNESSASLKQAEGSTAGGKYKNLN